MLIKFNEIDCHSLIFSSVLRGVHDREEETMPPLVGLFGFGKTGRAVGSVLLASQETRLEWVVRRSHQMEHRSVPELLGVESDEPGTIVSAESSDFDWTP